MQKKDKEKSRKLKYDATEGLLPEIRKTCGFPKYVAQSPPRSAGKKKKIVEEEWTMPEAQNCGFCSIGGDILCCELCPASFHLSCLGIEESDVPEDQFYCNRCKHMPKDVRLFPPEKCCPSTSPLIRIGNENRRNWETIKYQHDRLLHEAPSTSQGPMTEIEALQAVWPNKHLISALGMANPMDFNLPPEYLLEREFFPLDALEDKRPVLVGVECGKCRLQDEWSPMLKCDFCDVPWHQKCVDTPLVSIPRLGYWRCPRHTESLIDRIFTGDQVTKDQRRRLYAKYKDLKLGRKQLMDVGKRWWRDRIDAFADSAMQKSRRIAYSEDLAHGAYAEAPPTCLLKDNPEIRKGGKKNPDPRLFDKKFAPFFKVPVGETSPGAPKSAKNKKKGPEVSQKAKEVDLDDDEEDRRSVRFTEEELIMSVMPFDETAREEFLTSKTLGMDMEQCAQFFSRHCTMIQRCRLFYSYLSENELTKLMRRDLDPTETVRGSGIQTIRDYQDKTVRKKLKTDVEALIQLIGFGNAHAERRFTSGRTEAFFRRCNPPLGPQEVLNPGTLREVVLSSRKETLELVKAYHVHPTPSDLQNLVLLGYDTIHESPEARDSFTASSMTIWSKEPIDSIVRSNIQEKWRWEEPKKVEKEPEDVEMKEEEPGESGEKSKDLQDLEEPEPIQKPTTSSPGASGGSGDYEASGAPRPSEDSGRFRSSADSGGSGDFGTPRAYRASGDSGDYEDSGAPGPSGDFGAEDVPMETSPEPMEQSAEHLDDLIEPMPTIHTGSESGPLELTSQEQKMLDEMFERKRQAGMEQGGEGPSEVVKVEEEDPDTNENSPPSPEADEGHLHEVIRRLRQVSVTKTDSYIRARQSMEELDFDRDDDMHFNHPYQDRLSQSCGDIFSQMVIWEFQSKHLRDYVRRIEHHPVVREHSYARLAEMLDDTSDQEQSEEEELVEVQEQTPTRDPTPFSYETPSTLPRLQPMVFNVRSSELWDIPITPTSSAITPSSRSANFSSAKRRNSKISPVGAGGKRRGRPPGSKNRRDGDPEPTPKKSPAIRGQSARRGGRAARRGAGRGSGARGRGRGTPKTPEIPPNESLETTPIWSATVDEDEQPVPVESGKKLRKEVDEIRQKIVKKMLAKSLQSEKNDYFGTRDIALELWTQDDWNRLAERCFQDRNLSLHPYETRFFLPNERVHAKLEFTDNRLPIAIQRCLTKIGTARDCHLRLDWLTSSYCSVLADYHCDIVRDYYTNTFYLSTLATEYVIVNGIVVRRPQLTPMEKAEKMRFKKFSTQPSNLKCRCQKSLDSLISRQENSGRSVRIGIIELPQQARIQIGCAQFTFVKI